ncbi:auxin-responsive protein SAUR36-like [Cornus florida]|uniref:auxin-responsive protein SAUR36-like n=1 Tax=Cornus florida TaxID=4283 RepID=UPI0028A06323|nr:auxin-responsive protein SAUR36-like [Cornus florida]
MKTSPSKKLSEIIEKWRKRKKGHFAVYTKEGRRFVVPLYYLNHPIFRVLLEMAEEEFGLTIHGPLQVPCEEELMENILCLLRKHTALVSIRDSIGVSIPSLFPLFQADNRGELKSVVL